MNYASFIRALFFILKFYFLLSSQMLVFAHEVGHNFGAKHDTECGTLPHPI